MKKLDLDNYTPVDDRIKMFYDQNPNGAILTEIHSMDTDGVVFKAILYKDYTDKNPVATGFAQEFRDKELKQSKYGSAYESVNYTSHLENCETSAIGRALANLGFTGKGGRPSKEEMTKVDRMLNKKSTQTETTEELPFEPNDGLETDAIFAKMKSFKNIADFVVWFNNELKSRTGKERDDFAFKYQTEAQKIMATLS